MIVPKINSGNRRIALLPKTKQTLSAEMAGLYLHIPFCKQACTYCNFHFSTSLKTKDELVRALAKEAKEEKEYLGQEPVNTIYFGGGTPSILDESDIEFLLTTLFKHYQISPDS